MSALETFLKTAAGLPKMPQYRGAPSAPAAAAAAAAKPLTDARIVSAYGQGQLGAGVLPKDLAVAGEAAKTRHELAPARLERMKAVSATHNTASTPDREAAKAALNTRTPAQGYDAGAYEARKAYSAMPHSEAHHGLLQAKKEQANAVYDAKHNDAVTRGRQRVNDVTADPLPADYDATKARVRAGFDMNNTWHKNAPMVGALAAGAAGALTADPEKGEDRVTRGLLGAAGGYAGGTAIRHAAPHVAGMMGSKAG